MWRYKGDSYPKPNCFEFCNHKMKFSLCYLLSVFFTRWWVVFYAFEVGWWHCLSDKIRYKFIKCCLGDNPSRFARLQLCWYDFLHIFITLFSRHSSQTLILVPVIFTCTTTTHCDTLSKLKSRALRNLKRWASFGIYKNRNRDHLVKD